MDVLIEVMENLEVESRRNPGTKVIQSVVGVASNVADLNDGILDYGTRKLLLNENERRIGARYRAELHNLKTTKYEINGRSVEKFSILVLKSRLTGDNAKTVVEIANAQLARNGACVMVDGKPSITPAQIKTLAEA